MNVTKKVILITAGDPASISTEITIKAIETKKLNENILRTSILIRSMTT